MVTASDTKKSLRCQRPISSETRRHAAEGSARTSWRQPQAHLATKGFDQKHAEARERTDIMVAASATSWSTKLLGVARPAQQTATSTGPLLFSTFVSTARTAVKSLTSALTVSTLPVPSSPCTANHLLCCCNHDAETLLCACNELRSACCATPCCGSWPHTCFLPGAAGGGTVGTLPLSASCARFNGLCTVTVHVCLQV